MTMAFGITLLIGIGLGLAMGVPMGRFFERVRPRKEDGDKAKGRRKKKR